MPSSSSLAAECKAVVAPIAAVIQKVLPKQALGDVSQYLVAGEEAAREELLAKLVRLGYGSSPWWRTAAPFPSAAASSTSFRPTCRCRSGSSFSATSSIPIRAFDPVTQRSLQRSPSWSSSLPRSDHSRRRCQGEFAGRLKSRCDVLGVPAAPAARAARTAAECHLPRRHRVSPAALPPGPADRFSITPAPDTVLALIDPAAIAAAEDEFRQELALAEQRALERDVITCDSSELFLSGDAAGGTVLLPATTGHSLPGNYRRWTGRHYLPLYGRGKQRPETRPLSATARRF